MERRGESELDDEAKQYSIQMLSHCFRQRPCFGAAGENEEKEIWSRWVTTVLCWWLLCHLVQHNVNITLIIPSHISEAALNLMCDENEITLSASQDGLRSIFIIKQMQMY